MLVKNLELSFDRQEGDKIVLRTESGAEIIVDDYLLEGLEKDKKLYLNIDYQALEANEDSKQLLNDILLGDEEEK